MSLHSRTIVSILLLGLLILSFAACGREKKEGKIPEQPMSVGPTTPPAVSEPTIPTPEE